MNQPLANKVILITGAGRGLGRQLAEACAARGAIVAANDISPINVEAVVDGIQAAGGRARAYVHDVAKKVDVQAMINNISDDFGRIDVLITCARVEPASGLLEMDEWDLHRVFDVNAIGAFLTMQAVGRVMRAQGGGVIVSAARLSPEAASSVQASLGGLAAFSQRAASELAPHNILVYALPPGQSISQTLESLGQSLAAVAQTG